MIVHKRTVNINLRAMGICIKHALQEEALAKGEKCTFVGFGVFEVKDRAAREGRNPQDPSKIVKIPAKRVPAFRAGKALKEKVLAMKVKKKK